MPGKLSGSLATTFGLRVAWFASLVDGNKQLPKQQGDSSKTNVTSQYKLLILKGNFQFDVNKI